MRIRENRLKVVQLNSVVFHTRCLAPVRRFYVDTLGLTVATVEKNGQIIPDESDAYVNLQKDHPAFLKFEDIEGREIILESPST